jgi:hypothetical protein
MAAELARLLPPASTTEVRRVLVHLAGDVLEIRAEQLAAIEALTPDEPGEAESPAAPPKPRPAKAAEAVRTEAMPRLEKHAPVVTAPLPLPPRPESAPPPQPPRRFGPVAIGGAVVLLASVTLGIAAFARSGARASREVAPEPGKVEAPVTSGESPAPPASVAAPSGEPPQAVARPDPPPSASSSAPARTATRPRGRPAPSARPVPTAGPSPAPSASPPRMPALDPSGSRI